MNLPSACRPTAIAALLLAVALSACGGNAPSGGAASGPAAASVTTGIVRADDWVDRIEALGTVRANESVTLTAKVTETVVRVNFGDGDLVTEGQVLVDLTGRAEVASLEEAQANYTEALKHYRRQVDLVEAGTLPRSQLDTLIATRDAAKARMDAIRARLADRVIVAPFAGLLGFRQVSPGALVTPGTPIATLDDISRVKLDFSVPERHLAALAAGQAVEAGSVAWPGETFHGVVTTLGARVDPLTRALTVRAELPNPDLRLRPGMLLTLSLLPPPRRALVIPELALIQVGSQQSVFRVIEGDRVEQVNVRGGARRHGEVEIVEGLAEGDRIVVEGTPKLVPGALIVDASRD